MDLEEEGASLKGKRIIFKNSLSPGDLVMLSAAVRDLHVCYPGRFITDVRTPYPDLWKNNPHLTPLDGEDPSVETLECFYPLIDQSNTTPHHCIHGFAQFLNDKLGLAIQPSQFCGDIYLSDEERSWHSQVYEKTDKNVPFWVIDSGGKYDVTIKWWDQSRFQAVVDYFRDRILFVQVGAKKHHHPKLEGAIDLRGETTLRQLIRLIHHSEGSLCGVTALMHLTAAVPLKTGDRLYRPCVVVAGAREPAHWEAYPDHQFIQNVGALKCASMGGCWKDRIYPLNDGDERDAPDRLCSDVVGDLPRCMDMITADEVIRRIETYYEGGALDYLTPEEAAAGRLAIEKTADHSFESGDSGKSIR